jgi:hypothetical protein
MKLTNEARETLANLNAALDALGLTTDQAHALLLAEAAAEATNESEDGDLSFVLSVWQEDAHCAWADVLAEVGAFLED